MDLLPRHLVLACALVLFGLGGAYQLKGNIDLIAGDTPSSAVDLKNRDMEQTFFMAGQNPHAHMVGSQPPWAYQFGQLLVWPPWPSVRIYYAVLNMLALGFLLLWTYREARDVPPEGRLLLTGAVFAFGGLCTATEVGQVSILVTALLAGALWCDRSGRYIWCGVLVALAMIKPTIAAPFAFALIMAGRYRAASAAAAYGAVATAITWVVTQTSPFVMLEQMAKQASGYITDGTFGPVDLAAMLGASPQTVVWVPLLLAIPGVVLMAIVRPSLALAFAVATVWARLWTYHKSYDDVMLIFVMVPLGVLAFSRARSKAAAIAFFAMGVLAWIPGRMLALTEIQILQLLVWPVALLVLVHLERAALRAQWVIPRGSPAQAPLVT